MMGSSRQGQGIRADLQSWRRGGGKGPVGKSRSAHSSASPNSWNCGQRGAPGV